MRELEALPLAGPSEVARVAVSALAEATERRGPVLISAEPGCRPIEVAHALHAATRGDQPFVVVDCASADPGEIEARLFGASSTMRGSQDLETVGADAAMLEAGEGMLYLDTIDELPASTQRRLTRVLRDAEVRVAGARTPSAVPFRLVGATSKDLEVEAREGRFRAELLRRFGIRVTVPPLRQRSHDMPVILQRLAQLAGRPDVTITTPAVTVLAAMPWPGNIDELAAVFDRILAETDGTVRQEDVLGHLPIRGSFSRPDLTASLREARRRFERDYIAAVLERHQWRMSDAARTLGIERANLYRKTRQLGITRGRSEATAVNR
jgi:DNA-binding NtrC family response regulator